jgi:two-component system nitrogen regulation response regulator NtrX
LTEEALATLQAYPWPGNIRELSNMIAYVATMAEGDEVDVSDLPPKFRDAGRSQATASASSASATSGSFYERVGKFEKEILSAEYQQHNGNVSKLALSLGMDRSHLYTKLKEHGIHSPKK